MKSPILSIQRYAFLFFGLLMAPACKKEEKDEDTQVARLEAIATREFNDLMDMSNQAATRGELTIYKLAEDLNVLSTCATITLDTIANPKTCTIDFGSGCTGNDGKVRSGKVFVSFNGPYKNQGTVITITPENYFVNGNQISGLKTITNQGFNAQGFLAYTVEVAGTIQLVNNGGTFTWNSTRTREFIQGFNTAIFADDVYRVTGEGSGSHSNGTTWTANITSPLIRKVACRQFVEGVLVLNPSNKPQRTINYGNGACDGTATVTINGNSFTITIQ